MILEISHKTHYHYSAPVIQSQHLVHMSPREVSRQSVRHHSLLVEPAPVQRLDGVDAFGNPIVILEIEMAHRELVLHARSTIETTAPPARDFSRTRPWDQPSFSATVFGVRAPDLPELDVPLLNLPVLDLDVIQYRCPSRFTPASLEIADYAAVSFGPGRPVLEATMDLVRRIHREFTFDPTSTDISTPIGQVFKQRRGVCQDFSHLALAALRVMRVPARYVSGYILTHPAPGQVKLQGADASHAWISVWSPELGWVDFDPTNGLVVSDEHVTIAHGRDYEDVSPISGVLIGGGQHTVSVGVDIRQP
jgi:transglutaminase-like putative cysteine protease